MTAFPITPCSTPLSIPYAFLASAWLWSLASRPLNLSQVEGAATSSPDSTAERTADTTRIVLASFAASPTQ
eukprot:CAMPEP_0182467390 /NCGR_PEP_ID=MMETSP1319-20130603/13799_1 /TAXON_ID=172717 /ORGANISM="Bolidomonas pacifica, Strain RCC208" /LENGTH=70 /DNA_ID=CAMNT_0024667463 /DNA_START=9 /DNA_END=221 /DNA_ORIENTATION=-